MTWTWAHEQGQYEQARERAMTELRERLGARRLSRAYLAGEALALNQAIAEARA